MLTTVDFHFIAPDGSPIKNTQVEIQIAKQAYDAQDTGIVMPRTLFLTTDENGDASSDLFASLTPYHVIIEDCVSDTALHYKFVVPEINTPDSRVRLQDILVDVEFNNDNWDNATLLQVMNAKASATASQLAAARSAKAAQDALAAMNANNNDYAAIAVKALIADSIKAVDATYSSIKIEAVIALAVNGLRQEMQGNLAGAMLSFKEFQDALNTDASLSVGIMTMLANRLKFDGPQSLTDIQKIQALQNLGLNVNNGLRFVPDGGVLGDALVIGPNGLKWAPVTTGTTAPTPAPPAPAPSPTPSPPAPAPSPGTGTTTPAEDEALYQLLTNEAIAAKAKLIEYQILIASTGNITLTPDEVQYQALALEATTAKTTLAGFSTNLGG